MHVSQLFKNTIFSFSYELLLPNWLGCIHHSSLSLANTSLSLEVFICYCTVSVDIFS